MHVFSETHAVDLIVYTVIHYNRRVRITPEPG